MWLGWEINAVFCIAVGVAALGINRACNAHCKGNPETGRCDKQSNGWAQSQPSGTGKQQKCRCYCCRQQGKRLFGYLTLSDALQIFVGFALVVVTFLQLLVYYRQAGIMETQTGILDKQRIAADRSSTAGRGWTFFVYPLQAPAPRGSDTDFSIGIKFRLDNPGDTPSIITGVKLHLFVADGEMPFVEPDPLNPAVQFLHETKMMPITAIDAGVVIDENYISNGVVLPSKGNLGLMETTFGFHRPASPSKIINGITVPTIPILGRRMWLFSVIQYRDIFGFDRVTGYYARLSGADASRPEHNEYNCWDDRCPAALQPHSTHPSGAAP